MSTLTRRERRIRRHRRVRAKVFGTAERPRVSVFRSNRGISAQLIDDERGHTLAAVHWFEPELRQLPAMERTVKAGQLLAQRAKERGIERAVYDRGGYPYHGHVKAFAEALRENGITI
jgi:large subunit ribosomal protein L18